MKYQQLSKFLRKALTLNVTNRAFDTQNQLILLFSLPRFQINTSVFLTSLLYEDKSFSQFAASQNEIILKFLLLLLLTLMCVCCKTSSCLCINQLTSALLKGPLPRTERERERERKLMLSLNGGLNISLMQTLRTQPRLWQQNYKVLQEQAHPDFTALQDCSILDIVQAK